MSLANYPEAIAKCQRRQLKHHQYVRRLQDALDRMQITIDKHVAYSAELFNENQRKARRLELMQEAAFVAQVEEWQAAQDKKVDLEIELSLLKNQFAVCKLDRQWAIASRSEGGLSDAV